MLSFILNWWYNMDFVKRCELKEIVERYLLFHELDADVTFNDKSAIIILKNGVFNELEIKNELAILTKHIQGEIQVMSNDIFN